MADKEIEFNSYIASADDPATELEGDVKEKDTKEVDTKTLDVKIDDVPTSSGEKEDGGEVVAKIKREVLGEPDPDAKEEDGTEIPDAFTNACLEQGWTEDEIKEFASDLDDAALLELIPELLNKEEKQVKSESGEVQTKQEVKAKAAGDTAKKEATNEELAAIKKELAAIKESIGEADKERTTKEEAVLVETVNQVFDEASKEFEIFGKTDELLKYPAGPKKGQFVPTSPAMNARREVWEKAFPFVQSGIPTKDAMEIALTWYKGAHLEKDVQRNLIKDLKKHEKKLSAKRSGKETVKTYESEEERQAEVVREGARKAGIKGKYGI
ncbi:MAG: hypothetical protein E3J87_06405 [Candidatus Cloacimonadota bacterium]|nr:MAG: hypothetical protein E3J87_06405 [Candidatus Cloacimonadota bacterium]